MTEPRASAFITRNVLFALVGGGLGGILFMFFLIEFDHFTSTNQFCTTCHSMTFAETSYQQSVHYNSPSGVRASCGDCHVSEGIIMATYDHAVGIKDLFKQLFGADYNDPVINLLHLPDAAFASRDWFRRRDSATCRRCHLQEAIQGTRVHTAAIHQEETDGKSCVDCHFNLVHRPVPERSTFKREAWNAMVEQEFGLEPGSAEQLLAAGRRPAGERPPAAAAPAHGVGNGQQQAGLEP